MEERESGIGERGIIGGGNGMHVYAIHTATTANFCSTEECGNDYQEPTPVKHDTYQTLCVTGTVQEHFKVRYNMIGIPYIHVSPFNSDTKNGP